MNVDGRDWPMPLHGAGPTLGTYTDVSVPAKDPWKEGYLCEEMAAIRRRNDADAQRPVWWEGSLAGPSAGWNSPERRRLWAAYRVAVTRHEARFATTEARSTRMRRFRYKGDVLTAKRILQDRWTAYRAAMRNWYSASFTEPSAHAFAATVGGAGSVHD